MAKQNSSRGRERRDKLWRGPPARGRSIDVALRLVAAFAMARYAKNVVTRDPSNLVGWASLLAALFAAVLAYRKARSFPNPGLLSEFLIGFAILFEFF